MYAAMYPDFAKIARKNGYALAIHGSLQRDFDLIAIPWVENPSEAGAVIDEITSKLNVRVIGKPQTKHHGRVAWTISVGFGECAIDLSFMPTHLPG